MIPAAFSLGSVLHDTLFSLPVGVTVLAIYLYVVRRVLRRPHGDGLNYISAYERGEKTRPLPSLPDDVTRTLTNNRG